MRKNTQRHWTPFAREMGTCEQRGRCREGGGLGVTLAGHQQVKAHQEAQARNIVVAHESGDEGTRATVRERLCAFTGFKASLER